MTDFEFLTKLYNRRYKLEEEVVSLDRQTYDKTLNSSQEELIFQELRMRRAELKDSEEIIKDFLELLRRH